MIGLSVGVPADFSRGVVANKVLQSRFDGYIECLRCSNRAVSRGQDGESMYVVAMDKTKHNSEKTSAV